MKTQSKVRSNSKQVREAVKQHILDCVYNHAENDFKSYELAAAHLYLSFLSATDNPLTKKNQPNVQNRFSSWMFGLPFHFEYENHAIADFLTSTGLEAPENADAEKSAKLYHYLIFSEMMKVVEGKSILSRDGEARFIGSSNDCFIQLLKCQGMSTDWAIKYEGWKIQDF